MWLWPANAEHTHRRQRCPSVTSPKRPVTFPNSAVTMPEPAITMDQNMHWFDT
jgi:hypothetical protein